MNNNLLYNYFKMITNHVIIEKSSTKHIYLVHFTMLIHIDLFSSSDFHIETDKSKVVITHHIVMTRKTIPIRSNLIGAQVRL